MGDQLFGSNSKIFNSEYFDNISFRRISFDTCGLCNASDLNKKVSMIDIITCSSDVLFS